MFANASRMKIVCVSCERRCVNVLGGDGEAAVVGEETLVLVLVLVRVCVLAAIEGTRACRIIVCGGGRDGLGSRAGVRDSSVRFF